MGGVLAEGSNNAARNDLPSTVVKVQLIVAGEIATGMIDTGASVSLLNRTIFNRIKARHPSLILQPWHGSALSQ